MARSTLGGDPSYDTKHLRLYTKNEKGILQFGKSTTEKLAATKEAYDVAENRLIADAQLQQ